MTPAIAATFALAAALLAVIVALKRADQRASRWVDITHEGDADE